MYWYKEGRWVKCVWEYDIYVKVVIKICGKEIV